MPATQIGLLYSTATGIVLRTINPDSAMGDSHLDWVDQNKPDGTTLLRLNKSDIGADEFNCPNLDFLIPYVQKNQALTLAFGQNCAIVDNTNTVVDVVLACPVLYQAKLQNDVAVTNANLRSLRSIAPASIAPTVVVMAANIGDTYDPVNNIIVPQTPAVAAPQGNIVQ